MMNASAGMVLRIAFGVYFLLWGFDKIRRVDLWAAEKMLSTYYGNAGTLKAMIIITGIVQLIVAIAFLANFKTRIASIIAFVMVASSFSVTFMPIVKYLFSGGSPIPNFLFTDHIPLLAGVWAIYATAE